MKELLQAKSEFRKRGVPYKKTKKGLISVIYSNQVSHSKTRGHVLPAYINSELQLWANKQSVFHELYSVWVSSGFKRGLSPSVDRISDDKPYTLDNIQLMTWAENKKKGTDHRKSGDRIDVHKSVVQIDLDGNMVGVYFSQAEAERQTGIPQPNINKVCTGNRNTAGGYSWEYEKDKQ